MLEIITTLPAGAWTLAGVLGAALLTLAGVIITQRTTSRTATKAAEAAAGASREESAGELALSLARQATADVASLRVEVAETQVLYGLAHGHASKLHTHWPAEPASRPDWPTQLPPPSPTP